MKKTKFLAYVKKDDKIFYLGSNSKLIEAQNKNDKIPFIFGTFEKLSPLFCVLGHKSVPRPSKSNPGGQIMVGRQILSQSEWIWTTFSSKIR